jgi:transcription initiation factor TFIIIB Brf1 subunit/transcription initiation factor TFIIB
VTIVCPNCGAKNRVPDHLEKRKVYVCAICKTQLVTTPKVLDLDSHASAFDMEAKKGRVWSYVQYLVVISLAVYFAFYLYQSLKYITYPYTLDDGWEGFVLNQAYAFSNGHHLYHDISTYPYLTAVYTPVYILCCALFVRLFGVSYAIGRTISFVSILLVGFLIYRIIEGITKNRIVAVISSLLFFASSIIYGESVIFRVDTLGLLFSLLGIYIVFRHASSRWVYSSIPLFVLAVYTKESLVAAPIAAFLFLFLRDKRVAVTILAIFIASVGSIFLLANQLTDGQFYLHIIKYNELSFDIGRVIRIFSEMIAFHVVLVGFSLLYLWTSLSKGRERLPFLRSEKGLFALYFVTSAAIAVSVGKIGSGPNYFFEPIMMSCILVGFFLSELYPQIVKSSSTLWIVASLIVIQLLVFIPGHMTYFEGLPTEVDVASGQTLSSYVRAERGNILSEDPGISVLNGKQVAIELFVFTQLSKKGLWNQNRFLQQLENREFSLVILDIDISRDPVWPHDVRFTPEMIKAIRENYYLFDKVGDRYRYYVYKPNVSG